MTFNVADFRSKLAMKGGVLKTNKFKVRFYIPTGLNQTLNVSNNGKTINPVNIASFMEYFCEAAQVPGINFQLSENRRYGYGPLEKKPVTFVNGEAYFSIIGDAYGENLTFFRNWMKLIVNGNSEKPVNTLSGISANQYPYELSYKDDYVTNVEIYVYSDDGQDNGTDMQEVLKFTLRDAYPVNIGDVTLNWADDQNYMRIPIAFTFFDIFEKNEYSNSNN